MSDLIDRQEAIDAVGLNTWAGSRISQLPTVEAIPVEWIKEFLAKKGWVRHYLIDQMIDAWEAENETD